MPTTAQTMRRPKPAPVLTGAEGGKEARRRVPRTSQGEFQAAADRPDPVAILESQAASRLPELVPIRYGRMLASPFAFYRGAAAVMAADLAALPSPGQRVQLCGDAHASNFGIFASPERDLLFDANDFDETLPGPWEWDLKRLITSLEVAGRARSFTDKERADILTACSAAYRIAIRGFAAMGNLPVWYSRIDSSVLDQWRRQLQRRQLARLDRGLAKARQKDSTRALASLTTEVDGRLQFRSAPPLLVPVREMFGEHGGEELTKEIGSLLQRYLRSLRPELRYLVGGYEVVDMAHKVVGVGSVGLRAWVVLLLGRGGDPLVLQAKEAQASVLEAYVGKSAFTNHGERVVAGQRSMQAASDIFLGWLRVRGLDGVSRDFYLRQLWDGKGSVDLEIMIPAGMRLYGEVCAWTLARAHARSGDPASIAAYVGNGPTLDLALARFAGSYADQNDRDFAALKAAADSGRITAQLGV